MNIKVSVYIAISLDGFIAPQNGDIDWLNQANAMVPEGEDCGLKAFMDSVDLLVMGRKTWEQVSSFGKWPYGKTLVVVLSRNPITFPAGTPDTVTHTSEPPRDLLQRLSDQGAKHVYVDGGITIRGFLAAGLVDEITVTVIPVILGNGISPFAPIGNDIRLTHVSTTVFEFGFVQSTYLIKKTY